MFSVLLLLICLLFTPYKFQPLDFSQPKHCGYEELKSASLKQIDLLRRNLEKNKDENINLQLELNITKKELINIIGERNSLEMELSRTKSFLQVTSNKNGYVDLFDDVLFFYGRSLLTWHEAQKFCKRINASLLHSLDSKLNNFLTTKLKTTWNEGNVWIGGRKKRNAWVWETGDNRTEPMSWSYWAPNEPNDSGQCVHIYMWRERSYKWDDTNCNNRQRFVCAKF